MPPLLLIVEIMQMAVVISVVLLFFGIGILISIHLCVVGRTLSRNLRSRRLAERGISSSSVRDNGGGMSQEEVQKLPSFEYKYGGMYIMLHRMLCNDDDNSNNDDYSTRNMNGRIENGLRVDEFDCSECAICLDGFQKGDICRLLPACRHTFHTNCVDSWLYKNPLCPICRTTARQHGGERGTVVLENVLELAQVEGCEIGSETRDIATRVAVQGGVREGCGSCSHQPEMSNLVYNPLPSPSSLPTDEFVCNLMSTGLLPLQYRHNDDDGGGGRAIDVLSLCQNQSHNSQNHNHNSCILISTTRGIGVLSPSHSQIQNQNSNDSISIAMPSCRPPDEDGVRVNGTSIASQRQDQNQIVCDSTLSLIPHWRPPDDEGVRIIDVTCPDESQIQSQTRDGDAMARSIN